VDRERTAGQVLYVEGDRADYVWFVKSGTVVLHRAADDQRGEGRARAVRFAGSFIGLEALVEPIYRDTARATTDVVLCGATREGMDAWLGPAGTPARTALELTLRADPASAPTPSAPGDGSALQRVARWLSTEGPRGATLTLPRKIVADLLGMRPETLSRSLTKLADEGAIESRRTHLRIIDDQLLASIAGGAP
jgi:CRP-like cAMP-binding protein